MAREGLAAALKRWQQSRRGGHKSVGRSPS